MQKYYVTLALITIAGVVFGQTSNNSPYKFSSVIYGQMSKDSAYALGSASTDLSFTGLYTEALKQHDSMNRETIKISVKDSADFMARYHPVDARKFILEKARQNQIIIFNEAHHNPRNRVFVTSLLKDLKDLGYTYFAAETFMNDSFFVKEKHPDYFTGYYTTEPQFGNLVREALKLNLTLYPYEAATMSNGKQREIEEARNLQALLAKDPKAKIIVYCGYDHVREDSVPYWGRAMAGRLKEYTGVDPYTIDQVSLSERSEKDLGNPYFKMIHSGGYTIPVDKAGNAFNTGRVDALLYSPPTRYVHNRPGWIFENGKAPYFLKPNEITLSFPVIAKAYLDSDDLKQSIPIDVIEIKNQTDVAATAMALFKKGQFIIQLVSGNGETQSFKIDR